MSLPTPEEAYVNLVSNTPPTLRDCRNWARLAVAGYIKRNKATGLVSLTPVNATREPAIELAVFDDVIGWLEQQDCRVLKKQRVIPHATGVGFFLTEDDDYVVVEVDRAFDDTASLRTFAKRIRESLPMAYCERSRDGRSMTLLLRANLDAEAITSATPNLEFRFQASDWYVEFTGDAIGSVVDPSDDGTSAIRSLLAKSCRIQTANTSGKPALPSVQAIKSAACGRWDEVLIAAGMPADAFDGEPQPCPKCGGDDRFTSFSDFMETGGVHCRACFNGGTQPKPGDGIATLCWYNGVSFTEARLWLADYLQTDAFSESAPLGIIEAVCREKRMPLDGFLKFGAKPAKRRYQGKTLQVARVPVYGAEGKEFSHFDLSPAKKGKFKRGKGSSGMFFPGRMPKPGETWILVEGVKDAAALVGLDYLAGGLPSSFMNAKYASLFTGCDVVILPDLDSAGQNGAARTGGNLSGIAASVRLARLPGEIKRSDGDDVRDCLRQQDGERLVREAIKNAKEWEPNDNATDGSDRPEVLVTLDEPDVISQVIRHVGQLGWDDVEKRRERVYSRGGTLVGVFESEDIGADGRLSISPLSSALVRERIVSACQLVRASSIDDDDAPVPVRPEKWLTDGLQSRGYFNRLIRPLTGIIQAPTIRKDGTILQSAGYDRDTGLILQVTASFPEVEGSPTRGDAIAAVEELTQVVSDFPFQDDADRTAWLALVLTLVGRQCVEGCTPLFAVTANIRGAGKSKLADAASLIAYGRPAARKTFSRVDEEMRKAVTSVALEAVPSVLFDNVDIQVGGASLDAAITAEVWTDRILGSSKTVGNLPLRTVWVATGNNLRYGTDTSRRVLPIRLASNLESPEDRNDFRHENLEKWIKENRPRLAVAALTILRAYFVAGCPPQEGEKWGSFESWTKLIRGALLWAGAADPLPTRESATNNDESLRFLKLLITGIQKADITGHGLTTSEIEEAANRFSQTNDDNGADELKEAIAEVCPGPFDARRFGRRVASFCGRPWNGRTIVADTAGGGVKRWRVTAAGGAG